MLSLPLEAIIFTAIALYLGFVNGRHDSANVVALVISTRAMTPRRTLVLAAIGESIGPFLFGVAVAQTIGGEVIAQRAMTLNVVYAALFSAIVWNLVTLAFGIPTSTSHALIGGLIGPAIAGYGFGAVQLEGLLKVVVALLLSPLLGMLAGYYMACFRISWRGATRAPHLVQSRRASDRLQLAVAHGGNDARKRGNYHARPGLDRAFSSFLRAVLGVVTARGDALGTLLGDGRDSLVGAKSFAGPPRCTVSARKPPPAP